MTGGIGLAAPGAALMAEVQLFNPDGSNILIVVEEIEAGSATGTQLFEIRENTARLALQAGINKGPRDRRMASGAGEIWYNNANAAATGTRRYQSPAVLANTIWRYTPPWLLAKGDGMSVNPTAQNVAITVNFAYREVPVSPRETSDF